ncbi:hypothetical protein MXMO3_00949 [Maritalea myrionectae]|uniref:Uncharacterized protein n=1 Tax=Maritalea myrionectae TaxID=454601 RepID=A0A2R4MBV3_9HYPH|nr:hypothetical protein MXMO3_00949 [Maritalea myrionectae]
MLLLSTENLATEIRHLLINCRTEQLFCREYRASQCGTIRFLRVQQSSVPDQSIPETIWNDPKAVYDLVDCYGDIKYVPIVLVFEYLCKLQLNSGCPNITSTHLIIQIVFHVPRSYHDSNSVCASKSQLPNPYLFTAICRGTLVIIVIAARPSFSRSK